MSCTDLAIPPTTTRTTEQLLLLPLQNSAAPVGPVTFELSNAIGATIALRHNDQFNTGYAELEFDIGSVETVSGGHLGAGETVSVTARGTRRKYTVTISPSSLRFSAPGPTLTFSASVLGDFSVAGTRFSGADDLLSQLAVWEEISPDTWVAVPSTVDGIRTAVTANLPGGGTFALAVER